MNHRAYIPLTALDRRVRCAFTIESPRHFRYRTRLRPARYVSAAEHARRPVTFASSGPVTTTWRI